MTGKRKKRLGSTRFGIVFASSVLSLSIIGFLATFLAHTQLFIEKSKENIELHVYLENDLNETNRNRLESIIKSRGYINEQAEQPLQYLTQQMYTNRTLEQSGFDTDFEEILGWNPIRACYIIKLREEFAEANKLSSIKEDLESITGIYEVDLSSGKIEDIRVVFENLKILFTIIATFALIAILTISVLINNTIKLALFSQRFLIRSMKLVGAENSFIKKPFLTSAILQGGTTGIIASLITYGSVQYVYNKLDFTNFELTGRESLIIYGLLILLGIFISFWGSLFALNKYLKMSLDDLY